MNSRYSIQLAVSCLFLVYCATATAHAEMLPPPEGLSAAATGCDTVELTWQAPADSDNIDLSGYQVYRDGELLKWEIFPATSTTDASAAAATTHTYNVSALDDSGRLSPQSAPATATTVQCSEEPSEPSAPTGLTASAKDCDGVELSWHTPGQSGSADFFAYRVFRNGAFLKWVFPLATSTTDVQIGDATKYIYRVDALNDAGEVSPQSAPASVFTPVCASEFASQPSPATVASQPSPVTFASQPSPPTALTASATDCSTIILRAASAREGEIGGNNMYLDGTFLEEVRAPALPAFDGILFAAATYACSLSTIYDAVSEPLLGPLRRQ